MTSAYLTPNPDYGNGIYRRALRLTNRAPGEVFGELEDMVHAMRCSISHADGVVTAVKGEFVRWPMTTCPGAVAQLQMLVGIRLDTPVGWFFSEGRARRNCTHFYDLAIAMLFHARRDEAVRRYDVVIPDHPGPDPVRASLLRNGKVALEWLVAADSTILSPEPFAGRKPMAGFSSWATEILDPETLDMALVLQKGYWQSGARRALTGLLRGPIMGREDQHKGVCHTFSSPQFEQAVRVPSWRDFTDGSELLEFLPIPENRGTPSPQ